MNTRLTTLITVLLLAACSGAGDSNRVVGELASERVELTAEFGEPIEDILVDEGELITTGQVLLRQNDERAVARLAEASAFHLQSKARLDELLRGPRSEQVSAARANVEGATQDLDFRQNELSHIREIHQRGLASSQLLDEATAAQDAARANLKLRLAQLEEMLTGTTVEELAQAEQVVNQAAARRGAARIDVDRHVLKSPLNGILDSRLFEKGERPGIGQPVLVLLGGDQPYARVYIPERLRAKVSAGTTAQIFIDGLAEPVAGRVRWVASESAFTPYFALTERDRGKLSYLAKIDILDQRNRLPDGMPVEVELQLQ